MTKNSLETHMELTSFVFLLQMGAFWPAKISHSHPDGQAWGLELDGCWNWARWCDCQNDTYLVTSPYSKSSLLEEGHRDGGSCSVRRIEALGRGFSASSKKAGSRVTERMNWLYLGVSGFDIWLLTLSLSICVISGELANLAGPWFFPLYNGTAWPSRITTVFVWKLMCSREKALKAFQNYKATPRYKPPLLLQERQRPGGSARWQRPHPEHLLPFRHCPYSCFMFMTPLCAGTNLQGGAVIIMSMFQVAKLRSREVS